jgi:hypothetical protein
MALIERLAEQHPQQPVPAELNRAVKRARREPAPREVRLGINERYANRRDCILPNYALDGRPGPYTPIVMYVAKKGYT